MDEIVSADLPQEGIQNTRDHQLRNQQHLRKDTDMAFLLVKCASSYCFGFEFCRFKI